MADIDQILSGGQGTSTRADFSGLADIPEAYWKGRDRAYTQQGRDLFAGGVPKILDANGNPTNDIDWGEVTRRVIQHGDVAQGITTENVDIARQKQRFGNWQAEQTARFQAGLPPLPPFNSQVGGQSSVAAPPQPPLPPSVNSQAPVTTQPPINRGGVQPQPQPQPQAGSPRGDQPGSIVSLIQGRIPDELAGPIIGQVSAMARIDPNATIPPEMLPRIQQVVQAAIARMTGGGVSPAQAGPQAPPQAPPQAGLQVSGPGGGVVQPDAQGIYPSNSMITAGGPPPPVMAQGGPGSSAPIQPTPVPTQAIQRPASPVTDVLTSTEPPVVPSRAAKAIAYYQGVMGNVNSPPEQIQAAKIQLESLQKNTELTPEEKNYAHAVSQGFKGTMQQLAVKEQEDKANATKLGESFASKYDAAVEGAHIAASSKGTVQTALNIVKNDPNFYAGIGEAYNRSIKQIAAAIGLPDTSVGQQIVQKAVADQTVNSIRAFAASSPVGRVLQTEVEAITKSLGNSANTKEALGPLLQLRLNVLNTMEKVGDLAMNHNGGSGRLDPAYDRTVTNYMRTHPVIDANLRAQIEQATGQNKTQAPAAAAPVRVTSPGARDALPRGTQYIAPDGSIRIRQ